MLLQERNARRGVEINQIENDLYLFIGETYHANSTIFVSQDQALLVDALASRKDADKLRDFVEQELEKEVRLIVSTHYFSDHIAALQLFPRATIIAHENYLDTFRSEQYRSKEEESYFVEPDILISDRIKIRWGRFTLDITHNPGHTTSTLAIEVPQANLLLVGDTVVGNILYLRYSTPERFVTALERLRQKSKDRLISSHGDVRSTTAIISAAFYLESLRQRAKQSELDESFLAAPLEEFLPTGVQPTPFERIFHERNLQTIVERRLFAA